MAKPESQISNRPQTMALCLCLPDQSRIVVLLESGLAGAAGIEPATYGFGDRTCYLI